MPFIRLNTDFALSAAVKQFAAALNIPPVTALGHLIMLASALAVETEDGDFTYFAAFLLAEWAGWSQGALDFYNALKDTFPEGRLPDWDSINQPQREAAASAKRQRRVRQKKGNVTPNNPIYHGIEEVINGVSRTYALAAFEEAWKIYPPRSGDNSKVAAFGAFMARWREGVPVTEMVQGVMRYAHYCDATKSTGTQFVKQAVTFFGPKEFWKEAYNPPAPKPGNGATPQKYSYEKLSDPPPLPWEPTITVAGDPTPRKVGRDAPLEITERDEEPEPVRSPYGRRVE